ncbi:GWxTD domain-containing protein [Nevskia soli]|jgi:GWxTD domain-containing protein|uniref:GWxTD domain-containing protein n=1 Tax=Nevskia soli TaxID=418856 RepID=UPI0015D6B824|nr:GWxTD domain-containing protein [Nevskia soli]
MTSSRVWIVSILTAALTSYPVNLPASPQDQKPAAGEEKQTVAKPLTEKERKRREKALRKELETPYKKWLNEDVVYIITDEERKSFHQLNTDEEREQFIEQFWLRRDPTPDTAENEYKEEHYRRIAYANDHFASGIPGWKTDRGRIYITFGPPDEIESHPSGGSYNRPMSEGGGETSTYPFEQWRYRYLEGIGTNVMLEFVDTTMSGEFHLTMDPSEKDALLYTPNAGLTLYEQMGLSSKNDRFDRSDGTHLGVPTDMMDASMNEFTRLEQFANVQKPPPVKFKDLEAMVTSHVTYNILPMKVETDYIRVTNASVLTNLTLQFENKDLEFQSKEGVQKAVVNVFGRITTMSRRIVTTFEHTVEVPVVAQMLAEEMKRSSIWQESVPLAPGMYRLNIVCKDVVAGTVNNYEAALNVPRFDDEKLSSSSLILADVIEKVPTKQIGAGQFVVGTTKVRPRISDSFRQDEKMGIYLQLYNFGPDEKTQKPNGTIQYEIVKAGSTEKVLDFSEAINGNSASQITVEKLLPLQSMAPGKYELKMRVTDKNRNQTLTPTASFTVT